MKTNLALAALTLTLVSGTALAHGKEHSEPAPKAKATATPSAMPGEKAATAAESEVTIEIAGHLAKLVTTDDLLTVLVTEKDGAAPESATDAKLTVQVGSDKRTIAMQGTGGKFTAQADMKGTAKFVAVLQLNLDGKSRSGRFSVDRSAAPAAAASPAPAKHDDGHDEHAH